MNRNDGGAARPDARMTQRVMRENATEVPFANEYWDVFEDGIYLDALSGDLLFRAKDKFDAGCGWPSFSRPARADALVERPDDSHGMTRTEVRSASSDGHLGHVFDDGPGPEGLRYCINSAALRFVPLADSTAYLAGGCFWGMEEYFRRVSGVLEATSGYMGGYLENPDYESVCSGESGHAETVRVLFDPERVRFAELLARFFTVHDPTTKDRQGHDVGSQYRSAVFYASEAQRLEAERMVARIGALGDFHGRPIVTEIVPAGAFYPAEEYHQRYLEKHPGGYCHVNVRGAKDPVRPGYLE